MLAALRLFALYRRNQNEIEFWKREEKTHTQHQIELWNDAEETPPVSNVHRPMKIVPKPIDFYACIVWSSFMAVAAAAVAGASSSLLYQHYLLVNINIVLFLPLYRPFAATFI